MSEMFTVKKEKSVNKTVRMPESLVWKLNEWAVKKDVSFNQVVNQCCQYALEHSEMEMAEKE